jgi:hypothetical protein
MQSRSYAGATGWLIRFSVKLCILAEIRFAMFTPRLAIFSLTSILRLDHTCGVKAGFAFYRAGIASFYRQPETIKHLTCNMNSSSLSTP